MDRLGIALLALASLGTSAAQSTYLVQTLAGSDDVLDGGPALSALFAHIEGVATDAQGNVFIADADGHRIRRITPGGIVSTIAGTGHAGYSGDGGPAITAQLNTPYGVAADSNGNVYIADLGNARVRRISRDGVISTIAGGGTTAPNQSDGRAATSIALNSPRNVAVDSYGNVFFSDFGGHRVFEIITGGIILRVAGTGQAGYSGDGGAALFAQLNSPAGLAVDSSGALYIADSANGRIRKLVRGLITTVGDSSPSISLGTPTGIAIDTDGNLWIADPGAAQVLRVTRLLQVMTVSQPARDAAVDAAGNVYTCSGPYVYRRTRAGAVTIVAGSGAYAYSGDGGPAYKARMNAPSGIARDPAGVLYVADTGNHRIRKITPDGTI
jgi:trimeric autotransporter adhesin